MKREEGQKTETYADSLILLILSPGCQKRIITLMGKKASNYRTKVRMRHS